MADPTDQRTTGDSDPRDSGELMFDAAKEKFGHMVTGLKEFEWEQVPDKVRQYIQDNPKTSVFQLVCLLVTIVPGLIAGLALMAMGFSSSGPIAGWLAATYQSMFGTNIVFSALQSAAMGGYGVAIVNGIIQGSAVVTGIVTGGFARLCNWNKN